MQILFTFEYSVKQTGDENEENYKLGDIILI